MARHNKLIIATIIVVASSAYAATWVSTGKGSHAAAAGGPIVITATANSTVTSTGSSDPYTFSSLASGTASAGRISVVTIISRQRNLATGVTINGVTATKAIDATASTIFGEIWYAANPSGTTANVSITFGDSADSQISVSVFSVTGASSATPTDTNAANDPQIDSISISGLTIPASGGGVLGGANGEQTVAVSWTNATEYQDANAGSFRGSSAYTTTAGTPTITMDGQNQEPHLIVGAAWSP